MGKQFFKKMSIRLPSAMIMVFVMVVTFSSMISVHAKTICEPELQAGLPADGDAILDASGTGQLFERIIVEGITSGPDAEGIATQGVAIADFNGDGRPDLLLIQPGKFDQPRLMLAEDGCFNYRQYNLNMDMESGGNALMFTPTVADLNGDGFLDIYVSSSNSRYAASRSRLWLSESASGADVPTGFDDVVYVDRAEELGVTRPYAYHHGVVEIVDINRDGFLDILAGANQIGTPGPGRALQRIYIYEPSEDGIYNHGRFRDISGTDIIPGFTRAEAGSCDISVERAGARILPRDLDNDGDLDILMGCSNDMLGVSDPDWYCVTGDWVYGTFAWKNMLNEDGLFLFEELLESPENGLVDRAQMVYDYDLEYYVPVSEDLRGFGGLGMNTADVDNDGDLDVIGNTPTDPSWHVQSDMIAGRFWYNEGGFKFREATDEAGLEALNWTYGDWESFWDCTLPDNTLLGQAACGVSTQKPICAVMGTRDYQFMAGGGTVFADFNNDGWLDLLWMDRHELFEMYGDTRNMLFMNKGDGTFEPVKTEISGIDVNSMSAAARDLNGDGLVDLYFVASAGNSAPGMQTPPDRDTDKIFWNTGALGGSDNHWINVRLEGRPVASLIGAKIFAFDKKNGELLGRRDYFHTDGSYKVSQDLYAHFGLGKHCKVFLRVELLDGSVYEFNRRSVDESVTLKIKNDGSDGCFINSILGG